MLIDEKIFCKLVANTLEGELSKTLERFDMWQLFALQQTISKKIFHKMAEAMEEKKL